MSITIFDVETLALPDDVILKNVPEWDLEEAKTRVPKNYKKEEAISGWLEEDRENYRRNLLEKAALNPETATIAIAGFFINETVDQMCSDTHPETQLIEYTLGVIEDFVRKSRNVIGWNIRNFDCVMLIRRAWILGIKVPDSIYNPLARYPLSDKIVCMMEAWKAGNFRSSYTSLQNALKACELGFKPGGGEFAKLWREDKSKAKSYNACELREQAQLYRRMGVNV